ncbi:MAG: hypothetical protein IPN63_07720 [Gammaproteobacteria bacterium]|nr:hypothetical protein [Gammaproteobacteria bacterium]
MIGSDLVLGYVLCIGQIDAIEMVQINDVDASTITGVTVTTYLGTPTQGVDPTLASAIVAYNDSLRFDVGNGLRGIAYVVLRITGAANVGGWPRMRATIRGRKVFDPRAGITIYSDNTALCTADLISDLDYGLGLTATNVEDVADWCDSLLSDGTTKLSRIALVLENPRPILPDWLDLFSSYGEFYWIHEGADIKLVRDSAVDLASTPIEREWIAGTLSVRHEDTADAPRSVDVIYTVPRTDALPWATDSVRREFAGGAVTPTTLRMDGVISAAEADNKALARLNRTRSRVSVSFVSVDIGLSYQQGDVIVLSSPARGIADLPMRVLSIDMQGPGRYAISGERYDHNYYPSETPPTVGASLPAGGIILWSGGEIPSGFSRHSASDGKLIVGAGGTYTQSDTGGTGWNLQFTGNTTSDGAHTSTLDFNAVRHVPGGDRNELGVLSGSTGNPVHSHSYDSGVVAVNPLRRRQRLIKADSAQFNIPAGGQLFGVAGITGNWSRVTTAAGRILEGAAADSNTGAAQQVASISTGSTSDAHRHTTAPTSPVQYEYHEQQSEWFPDIMDPVFFPTFNVTEGTGPHTHTVALNIVAALKRLRLALYGNSADAQLLPGHIIGWEGGTVPTDWLLCNGSSGTPDARDFFIEIAATGNEGTSAGNNTVSATATTSQVGHSHKGSNRDSQRQLIGAGHGNTIYHDHDISGSLAIAPPYYALAFIMYSPGV